MSRTERDATRIVRSWLEDGADRIPDRILDAVEARLPATHQRRAGWLARRFSMMNSNRVRLGLAAAAVVIATFLGLRFLPGNIGTQGETPSPSAGATATPRALPAGQDSPLEGGIYVIRDTRWTPRPFTITVPDGWVHRGGESGWVVRDSFESDSVQVSVWRVVGVYQDSCDWEGTLQEPATYDELVQAIAEQQGHTNSGDALPGNFAGRPARQLEIGLAADFDVEACDRGSARLWPELLSGGAEEGAFPIDPGQTMDIHIVDLGSGEWVVFAVTRPDGATTQQVAQLEAVVASIDFDQ
jgi:hypothetical protein